VAVLGGTPLPAQLKALGDKVEVLPGGPETDAADLMREHTGAAAVLVRQVAPNATLVFAGLRSADGDASPADLLAALEQLLAAKPDVLLIPLLIERIGPPEQFARVLDRAAQATVVVVAAGNQGPDHPAQFDQSPLIDRILVADAVTPTGQPASFASRSKKVIWAPGDYIPVAAVDPAGKLVRQTQSGTSFSAALAAGVAARVREELPNLPAPRVVQVLKDTSRELTAGGPKVLRLDAALKEGAAQ
jgi:subtilisin family serine protease